MAWPSLNPGDLRHRITIESQSAVQDQFGGQSKTRPVVWTCWAEIRLATTTGVFPGASRESYSPGQMTSQLITEINIRWPDSGVTILPGMRVVEGSDVYEIQAVNDIERKHIKVQLLCTAINAGTN